MEELFANLTAEEPDSPMSEHIPKNSPFLDHVIKTTSGCLPSTASRMDLAISKETGDDRVVPEGYAQMLLPNFSNVPVQTEEIVQSITWNDQGAQVQSNKGIYQTKAVVLTVSVGVLQSQKIQFHPPLPTNKQDAIKNIKMGLAERICMVCDIDESWINGYLLVEMDDVVVGLECFPFGQNFVSAYIAGPKSTSQNISDISLQALRKAGYQGTIHQIHASQWHKNPFVVGSYSAAAIHHTKARRELANSFPPLFFAGEATNPEDYGTVHGAYESGTRVAQEVRHWLNLNIQTD